MKVLLLLAITTFAIASANALCLRNVDGRIFNLCPLDTPFKVPFDVLSYFSFNVSFSLARANTPACDNSTANAWASVVNSNDACSVATAEPTFTYFRQNVGIAGLNIRYTLDGQEEDYMVVRLMCNQTATARDTNINFFIDGEIDGTFTMSGYSYYGCPVKAADYDKNFLQF